MNEEEGFCNKCSSTHYYHFTTPYRFGNCNKKIDTHL